MTSEIIVAWPSWSSYADRHNFNGWYFFLANCHAFNPILYFAWPLNLGLVEHLYFSMWMLWILCLSSEDGWVCEYKSCLRRALLLPRKLSTYLSILISYKSKLNPLVMSTKIVCKWCRILCENIHDRMLEIGKTIWYRLSPKEEDTISPYYLYSVVTSFCILVLLRQWTEVPKFNIWRLDAAV